MAETLLSLEDLHVHFQTRDGLTGQRQTLRAVNGVSLDLAKGETLGLVGESGCGKSTLVRATFGIVQVTTGKVMLKGIDLTKLNRRKLRAYRPEMQIVFQDPYTSLDPRMTVHEIIAEPLRINNRYSKARVNELLEYVGMTPDIADRLPASFSGGQRQRIGISRALALEPEILVLDEPVSALDVSIQAQVINLLKRLQGEFALSYLFIAHDLAVVRHVSDRIAVMYLGKIVELGTRDEVFENARHPYTRSLLSAIPVAHPIARGERRRITLRGDPPDPSNPPSGCTFRTRCDRAQDACAQAVPVLDGDSHKAACFFPLSGEPSAGVPV